MMVPRTFVAARSAEQIIDSPRLDSAPISSTGIASGAAVVTRFCSIESTIDSVAAP
jgi:hypothetical protein